LEVVLNINCSHKKTFTGQMQLYILPLIALTLCWCMVSPAWAGEKSNLLDGKSYVGKNGEVGQKLAEYEDEEILFQDGLFTSASCEPYNFGSSPYNTKVVGDKIHFDAVTESPSHGKISWHGVIDAEDVDVTFVWTKERWYWDTRREYWFRGKLKE
jgi:hypothetical protein